MAPLHAFVFGIAYFRVLLTFHVLFGLPSLCTESGTKWVRKFNKNSGMRVRNLTPLMTSKKHTLALRL